MTVFDQDRDTPRRRGRNSSVGVQVAYGQPGHVKFTQPCICGLPMIITDKDVCPRCKRKRDA